METKGVTCKIPLELHNRISEEIRETESTMSKFIERIITEHYEKGAVTVMGKGRTLAFQVSEELFQRVKELLHRRQPSPMQQSTPLVKRLLSFTSTILRQPMRTVS